MSLRMHRNKKLVLLNIDKQQTRSALSTEFELFNKQIK